MEPNRNIHFSRKVINRKPSRYYMKISDIMAYADFETMKHSNFIRVKTNAVGV